MSMQTFGSASARIGKNTGGTMAKLTDKARSALPSSDFALPGKRAYPIENRSHAANAKARAANKPEVKGKVDAAVARRYPDMGKKVGLINRGGARGR